ncbi:MAG: FCD domain-containing protein [Rhodoplanes sp.]|uniref:GntR family transcriptional regulator n=1 Tax=Rhodoplanes sp. TaxID=1968906 RepID=UPI0017BFC4BF|nr:FCD domain-containing protein [Rhodoplanes sp.]NVO13052.1 FCD domain-containing protein [Rhodoplanes sp.]
MAEPASRLFRPDEADDDTPSTATEAALKRLKRDLIRGVLPSGRKLKIRELTERYGIGASPMREALAQLASGGFVNIESNKGFRVAPVSRSHLVDITQTRQIVEGEALRHAIANRTEAWEEEIFTSFQLLKWEIDRRDSRSEEWLDAYEERHRRFHLALIAACPLTALKQFCEDLYTQMTRYRRMLKEMGFSEQIGSSQHEEIMSLVLDGDVEKAVATLRDHIAITATAVLADDRI